MKNPRILIFMFFALTFSAMGVTSCSDDEDIMLVEDITITEDERGNLLFMREEEKLARDVYLYLFDKYDLNLFSNIASGEQSHMDAVLNIMTKYGVEDIASSELGDFVNTDLQALYDALILKGDLSLIDALMVGATIEDVDIRDLDNAIDVTSQAEIIKMFEMLNCGSRNHMRAFADRLDVEGVTYVPQFISQEDYEEVISGGHERCGN